MMWILGTVVAMGVGSYLLVHGGVWLSRRYDDWSQGPITIENWRARLKTMSSKIDQTQSNQ